MSWLLTSILLGGVGMTRGRYHNLASVITEPAGDEHTDRRQLATAEDVLAGALRHTSAGNPPSRPSEDELEPAAPQAGNDARAAIIEGLRQAQHHSYDHTVRRQFQHQAIMSPDRDPAHTLTHGGPATQRAESLPENPG